MTHPHHHVAPLLVTGMWNKPQGLLEHRPHGRDGTAKTGTTVVGFLAELDAYVDWVRREAFKEALLIVDKTTQRNYNLSEILDVSADKHAEALREDIKTRLREEI